MEHHQDFHFETAQIHAGGDHKNPEKALNYPIFQTSTFSFEDTEQAQAAFRDLVKGNDNYIYTRISNPTIDLFEQRMAALEGGVEGAAAASGMAAISAVLFSLLKSGDTAILHKTAYGDTYGIGKNILPRYDVNVKFVDCADLKEVADAIDDKVKLIYFETPANPTLAVVDIEEVCKLAKPKNIKVIVDNTFPTPYLCQPLKLGADIVVHSATKYICGHGDAVGGVVVGKDAEYMKFLKYKNMKQFGGCISPFNAWLLLRGLKTLSIRMDKHEQNAQKIAEYLAKNPKVKKVLYPGLESCPAHVVAKKQMKGYGAMISFELNASYEDAVKFVNSTKLITLAVSLGDCESLIQMPASMTHSGYNQEQLEEFGLSKTQIRLSVGIENADDLIKDLEQAFKCF